MSVRHFSQWRKSKPVWAAWAQNRTFCNSHWFGHQLPLLWQALSGGFCKYFSTEKALSAPSAQLWFLISLRSACQALPHPSGQSDGYAAAPGLPSADQSATEVTAKEATGAADSYRDWDLLPLPPLSVGRDAKMSFSFPQESDLLKTNSWLKAVPFTQHTKQDLLANRKAQILLLKSVFAINLAFADQWRQLLNHSSGRK